jgi:glycosyltransferase involved in cell wall biosynthesis
VNFALPHDFCLLQITPRLDTGGVEQTTLDVAEAVVRAGGRALVASEGGRLAPELAARGGVLVRLPMDSKNPFTVWRNGDRLARLIKRESVSLIHARSRMPAWSALRAARRTGTPFVTTYHGVYSARSGLKRGYNAVMASGDVVIANSTYTRNHVIAEHGIDPLEVVAIPRGVDLARFSPDLVSAARISELRAAWGVAEGEARVVVLLAGRLTRWKGQALLVEATKRLKQRGVENFIVILAGDDQGRNAYERELRAAIAAAGLTERVRLVGHCHDMPAAYLACDLAVAPSLKPEAFGRTAVEPQTMGRPVLAADHGATSETVIPGETGWLVKPGDADAWADALAQAVALTPEQRAAMGAAAAARTRRLYSLQAMTDATLDIYAGLLMSGAGRRR